MTSIDNKSLSDSIARGVDQYIDPQPLLPETSTPCGIKIFALIVSLLGASMAAIGAYVGNQELFGDNSDLIIGMSIMVAGLKFCQSLAVEGSYTFHMSKTLLPACCGIQKPLRTMSVTISPILTAPLVDDLERQLNNDGRLSNLGNDDGRPSNHFGLVTHYPQLAHQ